MDDTRVLTVSQVESWVLHVATMESAAWLVLNCGVYLWAGPTMHALMRDPRGPARMWDHLQDRLMNGYRVLR